MVECLLGMHKAWVWSLAWGQSERSKGKLNHVFDGGGDGVCVFLCLHHLLSEACV